MDLETLAWDPELLDGDAASRPRCSPRSAARPRSTARATGDLAGVPIAGDLGDQQAALFGQACFEPGRGQVHVRHGLLHAHAHRASGRSTRSHGLITTVAARLGGRTPATYALEGSVAVAGSLIQWLRDDLGIITRRVGGRGARPVRAGQRRRRVRARVQRPVRPALADATRAASSPA